jgi:uncharacterized protein (TIGR03382 family)
MRGPWHALFASSLTSLLVVSAGCPQPRSENETLELQGHGVHVPPRPGALAFTAEQPILVGSRVCPNLHCAVECPSVRDGGTLVIFPDVSVCYTSSVDGTGVVDDGGCLTFEQEGAVAWRQAPVPCALEDTDGGWAPTEDSFLFVATTLSGLEARFEHALEGYGAETLVSDEPEYVPTADFPADFLPAPGEALHLLAGEQIRLPVTLVEVSSGRPVGYQPAQVTFEVTETMPSDDGGPAADVTLLPGDFPLVTMAAGGEVELAMRLGEGAQTTRRLVGTVRGVAAAEVASLEVHSFRPEPADAGTVLGLRAIARDGIGHAVFGVPIAWELTAGRFVVEDLTRYGGRRPPLDPEAPTDAPGPGDVRADWIYLSDECRPPAMRLGTRSAEVTARFAELEVAHTASWQQVGPEPSGAAFDPSPRCEGVALDEGTPEPDPLLEPEPDALPDDTCGCQVVGVRPGDGGPAAAGLGVASVGWLFWRRRRRA